MTKIAFGCFFELSQNQRGDFRRRVFFVLHFDFDVVGRTANDFVRDDFFLGCHFAVTPAHESLDGVDGVGRIGDRLPFGRLANKGLPFVGESDDAGRNPVALQVGNDFRLAPFHHRNDGVGGSQIDTNDFFACNRHPLSPITCFVYHPA